MCWVLADSQDAGSPYCSKECREQDSQRDRPMDSKAYITSPMPPPMLEVSRRLSTASQVSRGTPPRSVKPEVPRPQLATVQVSSAGELEPHRGTARDRRAFSFPTAPSPIVSPHRSSTMSKREARQSSGQLPPFARKQMAASPGTFAIQERSVSTLRPPRPQRQSVSTGMNTPFDPESVFCSTSESEEGEISYRPPKHLLQVPLPTDPTSTSPCATISRKSPKAKQNAQSNKLPIPDRGPSPVAVFVASSASSRSREDIISWARAVDSRLESELSEEDEDRGRSRTRRQPGFTPIQESIALPSEDKTGSTPKGALGSALAGLGRGFGVVKALTGSIPSLQAHAANSAAATALAPTSALGLQSVPAPAEVSNVAVITSSGNALDYESTAPPFTHGGATPTLSTISYTEAIEQSVADQTDNVDIVTDDASTSSFANHSSPTKVRQSSIKRESAKPASALWNLSSYLRSFTSFASFGAAPVTPESRRSPAKSSLRELRDSRQSSSSPMPLTRAPQEEEIPEQETVRSIPMDIVTPPTVAAQAAKEERERIRDAGVKLGRSRSRASRSLSRRRPSRMGRSPRSVSSNARGRHTQKVSYDADASETDDEPRGRSRRGKMISCDRSAGIDPVRTIRRQLSHDAGTVLGDRSISRGPAKR